MQGKGGDSRRSGNSSANANDSSAKLTTMRILLPIKGLLPRVDRSNHCVLTTSLPSFSSWASPLDSSANPTSSYSESPMAWMGMLRFFSPGAPCFRKVRWSIEPKVSPVGASRAVRSFEKLGKARELTSMRAGMNPPPPIATMRSGLNSALILGAVRWMVICG